MKLSLGRIGESPFADAVRGRLVVPPGRILASHMRSGKPTIIGEAPSQNSDPARPFYGASGRTLAFWAGLNGGCIALSYAANLRNVLQRWPGVGNAGEKGSRFPMAKARRAASRMKLEGVVILAGRRVAKAFGLGELEYFRWTTHRGATVAIIPHPSGCNRFYNDQANRIRAAKFLRGVLESLSTREIAA